MSYELNKKIRELEPYEPISGTYKIRLDANECPENYPDFIKEEIKNAIDTIDFNRYPDPLAEKVVTAFADYYGINPKYVTAGNGSDEKRGQDALRCSRFFNVQILFINL